MRLGIYQFAPVWGNIAANLTKIEQTLARNVADLWVLPELCTTGYLFTSAAELRQYADEFPQGHTAQVLAAISQRCQTAVVAGVAELYEDKIYNSAVLFNAGILQGIYRKVHLFNTEKVWFQRGTQPPPVFNVNGWRVGIMICFDWIFPEMARSLALQGAQIIAHPANLVLPYCQNAVVTRSIENRVFTATANRIGKDFRDAKMQISFTGKSQIVSPAGVILGQLSADNEEILILEINPQEADDKNFGPGNNLFEERYPAAYLW